jgi:hypothetical protein
VGGPTEIPLIDLDRAFLIGPTVAATFDQVTHIEVAIEPRPIR